MTTETVDRGTVRILDETTVEVTFDDMYVLSAEDVDAFALDWNEQDSPPPYYVLVDGRRFRFTGATFLVRGYGAELPDWVKEEEGQEHLVLFVEREDRLLAYVHDPVLEAEEAEEAAAEATAAAEASAAETPAEETPAE